ncbi:MAG: hypothetical protein ABJG78_19360 [Cyclobacteriaceae bacterium]
MESEHLHFLINEEIYAVKPQTNHDKSHVDHVQSSVDAGVSTVANKEPLKGSGAEKTDTNLQVQPIEKIKIAFIYQSSNSDELELLNKIIGACKLEAQDFKVFKEGESAHFEKAVIFTDSASSYCIPSTKAEGEIMYSKPLNILFHSPEEKRELWGALQSFVG